MKERTVVATAYVSAIVASSLLFVAGAVAAFRTTPDSSVVAAGPIADPRPPSSPTTTTPPPVAVATLRPGDRGGAVATLQARLVALGYWDGDPSGTYGPLTAQAVIAFQKVEGLGRDGIAGPETIDRLARATRPPARSGAGDLVEIDLARQVLFVVRSGSVRWAIATSTGAPATPTTVGRFHVLREVNGEDHAPNGVLHRPKYFHNGEAIHGYPQVPAHPASHGCARVSNAVMDFLWSEHLLPIGSVVWVY
jgi:peptidoglycan hydrolase-like protein with peptidoglycan-binding domain